MMNSSTAKKVQRSERLLGPVRFQTETTDRGGVITGPGQAWQTATTQVMISHGWMSIRTWKQAGGR
ncbi:MAG: hypothetical protein ACOX41_08770 [Anaerovoracaceae bacterium]|jgi:hypothetical protein